MKKLFILILSLIIVFSLASCEFFNLDNNGTTNDSTASGQTTLKPTPTQPNPTTSTTKKDDTTNTHLYQAFTSSEKSMMKDLFDDVIPFIPNDDYYVKVYTFDNDDGTTETGINFYTYGNTSIEFNSYMAKFSSYTYDGSEEDDEGDTWYLYTSSDGSY